MKFGHKATLSFLDNSAFALISSDRGSAVNNSDSFEEDLVDSGPVFGRTFKITGSLDFLHQPEAIFLTIAC